MVKPHFSICSLEKWLIIFFLHLLDVAKLSASISSRLVLNMAANIGLQYSAEILPTPVRARATGMIHAFGFLGHAIAPFINIAVKLQKNILKNYD